MLHNIMSYRKILAQLSISADIPTVDIDEHFITSWVEHKMTIYFVRWTDMHTQTDTFGTDSITLLTKVEGKDHDLSLRLLCNHDMIYTDTSW